MLDPSHHNPAIESDVPEVSAVTGQSRHAPLSWRSVLIGLAGAAFISAQQVAYKVSPNKAFLPFHSALTLFPGVISLLFGLAILNAVLKRWFPRAALRPAEFAVIYGIATVAAAISAQDEVQYLIPMWLYPFRATQKEAMEPFRPFIPHWLTPHPADVIEPYYVGAVNFWQPHLLWAWLVPLLCWMTWLSALGATMWAWNVILRRRWMDHDRLAFPCIRLPLEMCREAGFGGSLKGGMFWGGFLLAVGLESLSQLHNRFPGVPALPLDFNATPLLEAASPPWNALAPMYLAWTTLHLGVCFFIPLDILFSAWFFYLFRKSMEVFGRAMGWRDLGWDAAGFPFTRAQAAGAWIALFFLLVWAERHHLRRVLALAFSRRRHIQDLERQLNDADEPGSYRWAGRILVFGTLFMVFWSIAAGMSPWLALVFYAFFWALNITMTRIYAQVGPPILELYFLDPQKTLTTIFGTFGQSPASLTHLSLLYWINRDDRGQPMAHQLAAFRAARITNADPRGIGKLVLIAFLVGCVTCLLAYLYWAYRVGEDQFVEGGWRESASPLAVSRIRDWVLSPKGPRWTEIAYMVVGATITLTLAKLSYVIIGFPFHPIGFALAMCFAVEYNWPAFLMMWLVKLLLLRYGGRQLYLRCAPLFLGLILGGLVVPMGWGFIAWLFNWYS
jgi:hypothetical protein